MGLPPPTLRDLTAWIQAENSRTETDPKEIWEIGVPAKKSLAWSLVLSVLFTEKNDNISNILRKLTGNEFEINKIKEKKNISPGKIDPKVMKNKLKSFNPFKNRHNFFHLQEVSEIVRIFEFRLNQNADKLRSKYYVHWSDDLKLRAASKILACRINVYFPDEIETGKFTSYSEASSNFTKNVVLFEYENQIPGEREDPINIFRFGMKLEQAHDLKLDALSHFLKKAKISSLSIQKVKQLMNGPEAHGKAFLPTIMQNSCLEVLPEIYRSPYIAFKLSEAGFETDPVARIPESPSPLCYALTCSGNPKYLRILYNYASNCRCLFNRSVRKADDTVLETLKRIKSVIESDLSKVNHFKFKAHAVGRALHALKQLHRFVEYQYEIAFNLRNLNNKHENKEFGKFQFRKEIIESILGSYLKFFHYETAQSENIAQQLTDFTSFSDYYDYTDTFAYISFFDNFYELRLCFGLKEEHMLLNVELEMFLAMISNRYFTELVHERESEDEHNIVKCEKNRNILRHIPLLHRKAVESEVNSLLKKLEKASNSDIPIIGKELARSSHSSPYVIDEIILARLQKYIQAVQEVSLKNDGMKAVLVIERAMQVIGESIKPPSSMDSIVSFLLRSCLPSDLQAELICIRNDLSKYRSNSVYGRLSIESDSKYFEGIKDEFKKIQEAFKIVHFTQYLRTEEIMMCQCHDQLKNNLEADDYAEFQREYELRLLQRSQEYEKHHRKCIKLLLDSFSDLHEQSKKTHKQNLKFNISNATSQMQHLFGQLKSIEYLLKFIGQNKTEKYIDNLLSDVQDFIKINKDKNDNEINKLINNDDHSKEMKNNCKKLNEMMKENKSLKQVVQRQLTDLQSDLDDFLPKCKEEILKNNSKKDVTLSAPYIKSFFKSLKKNVFLREDIEKVNDAVGDILKEAIGAKNKLEEIFKKDLYQSNQNVDELLNKILIPSDKIAKIRSCYDKRESKEALQYLKKSISESSIKNDIANMLDKGSLVSGYAATILTKLVFQRYLDSKFYTSPTLPDNIYEKLENFLTKKVNFLNTRLKILKEILIKENEEIQATWKWGKSGAIKYHLKFLMRQRYMREKTVCASLEMAFFDCTNIFHESSKDDDMEMDESTGTYSSLRTFYKKSTDLFAGIDLRNIVSHRSNIPETIGEILDEEDFPSEMIEKMLELIDDTETIESMLKLFKVSGVLDEKDFVDLIENSNDTKLVKVVTECSRWREYLLLFPFIKTKGFS